MTKSAKQRLSCGSRCLLRLLSARVVVVALLLLAFVLYMLFRPYKEAQKLTIQAGVA